MDRAAPDVRRPFEDFLLALARGRDVPLERSEATRIVEGVLHLASGATAEQLELASTLLEQLGRRERGHRPTPRRRGR
ncbi:hypothetical protein SK069_02310 [Patulibacter brassicae]|uniref:Uncharacterized protein n=1 Tax=Patulibacter brassicae TaxID=1705717 RepID=A0ABU4VF39_9ACTN|nr:hypothetical protein [Patulibacter brassicae]MDX8150414.1 hypothetical protein [Patulibacter brassicae]